MFWPRIQLRDLVPILNHRALILSVGSQAHEGSNIRDSLGLVGLGPSLHQCRNIRMINVRNQSSFSRCVHLDIDGLLKGTPLVVGSLADFFHFCPTYFLLEILNDCIVFHDQRIYISAFIYRRHMCAIQVSICVRYK